jgi:hypothetical protein
MMGLSKHAVALLACAVLVAGPAAAEELSTPTGEVLLTVTGAISATNEGDAAVFDFDMLKAVGEVTFSTSTPWTEGKQDFTGVPLEALLRVVGATGSTLTSKAINDYAVDIPASDAVTNGPIIAYLLNGEPMSVREKGPLWVVYPYDSKDEYRAEVYYSRSIWQLTSIDVKVE